MVRDCREWRNGVGRQGSEKECSFVEEEKEEKKKKGEKKEEKEKNEKRKRRRVW